MSINIQETFQKMPLGEKIIVPAAVVLLIDSFLPWYHVSCVQTNTAFGCVGGGSASGWAAPGSIWSILAVLIGLVMGAVIVVSRFTTVQMPALPQGVTWARVHLGLGVAAALFVIIKLLNESSHLGIGFFIGIVCVAALVAGGGLLFQAEGGFASLSSGKGGGTTSPPGSTM